MPVTGGWQHRLDGLPTQPVQRPALFAVELVRHLPRPRGLGFLHRRPGPVRAEVVAPPTALRSGRHQSLDATRFERRHLGTVGIAVVRQNRLGPAQSAAIAAMTAANSLRSLVQVLIRAPTIS